MHSDTASKFIKWLTTQSNARGELFTLHRAKHYANNIRYAIARLELPSPISIQDVFNCRTLDEFDTLRQMFLLAPNYWEVNRRASNGAFSAGLSAFRRYMEYVTNGAENSTTYGKTVLHTVDIVVCQLDFANTESCFGTIPLSCFVQGDEISCGMNWRDLLVSITDYCLIHYPNHMERLKTEWFSNYSNAPYLLMDKPPFASKEISNGCWINVNHSISQLVRIIVGLLRYCGINLSDVKITYTSKNNDRAANESRGQGFDEPSSTVSQEIIDALNEKYANGFRFDITALRLLSAESGIEINGEIQTVLKRFLFRRNDDVYFLPDIIADTEMRKEIVEFADEFLDEYGFFEMSELYALFAGNINDKCIYDTDSFESFYLFINKRNVRCVAANGTRIARVQNENVRTLFSGIADKALSIIQEKFDGVVREDDLRAHFLAISTELLSSIIGDHIEDIVKTEINGIVCYQTLDTLGLPDDFSETLSELLSRLDELELSPTDEVLHTALSLTLGVNFKAEYNIPDDKTYRRLIALYYEETPKREWKYGKFAEVRD
jgi:hypothetical protein